MKAPPWALSFDTVINRPERGDASRSTRLRGRAPLRRRGGSTSRPIRVGLVDDHASVRRAIGNLVSTEQGMEVAGEAETIEAALEMVRSDAPDVVLLDLGLRDGYSLPAIPALIDELPGLEVIVLTMHDEPGFRASALRAGAAAYLLKDAPPSTLIETISATQQP
jgi:DNA-binding NarL/FixJ family response regulator